MVGKSGTAALIVVSQLLAANAHMFIASPPPISASAPKDPLIADGSNFPCHGASLSGLSGANQMAAGSSQLLAFDLGGGANTATHGGGSCQMSITYETDEAALKDPTNWKVIHSFEGGCPTDFNGNVGTAVACDGSNEAAGCVNSFNFTIPKGVKDGNAIMAWTWYNNVGNRELYMNCIDAKLTGGDGSEMDEFPTMFIANINLDPSQDPTKMCGTTESNNVQFPYPGKYVTTESPPNYPFLKPAGAACEKNGAPVKGDGGAGQTVPSGSASSSVPAYTAPPSGTVSSPAPTMPGSAIPSASYTAPPLPSGTSTGSSGSCPAGRVPCTGGAADGDIVCIGKYQFAICANGCMIPQALAAGTQCQAGSIVKRSHIRHARRHYNW